MGAATSNLTPEEVQHLAAETKFKETEIQYLYYRFKELDRSKSGNLSRTDLELIPELSMVGSP